MVHGQFVRCAIKELKAGRPFRLDRLPISSSLEKLMYYGTDGNDLLVMLHIKGLNRQSRVRKNRLMVKRSDQFKAKQLSVFLSKRFFLQLCNTFFHLGLFPNLVSITLFDEGS